MPIVGEIATGVAAGLVLEGIKRPLSLISDEVRRRDQISRALNDRQSTRQLRLDHQTDLIASDLSRVIGNAEGKLTEQVADFLREIRKTAIPQTIAHAALCGSSPNGLLPALESFYSRFSQLPFTSSQFLDAYYQASLARVEAVDDRAMLDIIRAQHAELSEQLRLLTASLSRLPATALDISTLREARTKLAKQIEAEHRYVNVETLQGSRRYQLRSLAIPGRLLSLDTAHIQSAKAPTTGDTKSYISFRKTFQRSVILGDPGGGKSTLTQLLSYDLAKSILLEAGNPERREFEPRDLKLPLRIILRSFEAKKLRAPSYNFLEYLKDELCPALDNDISLTNEVLLSILSTGEAAVIFDGLDEVLDIGSRRSMVSYIEQFSAHFASCPVLVTSRLVGYRDAPLSDDFIAVALARFSPDEISSYAEKAIQAIKRVKRIEARGQAEEFVRQSSKVGGDLRENPLMLGLMVQIFVARGDVPSNRPEVYKECATLMFEKWDERRDIIADVPRRDIELLDVFGYVASRTFGNAESEEGVEKSWLVEELRKHFEGWYVDKASARRAASSLVDFLTGRAWVMSEVGKEVYKFTHRTFLEYFFARGLISESTSIKNLLVLEILPRVLASEWAVISHLALHMATFRDGGKARQAAEALKTYLLDLEVGPQQEVALLEFVAQALDYMLIPEALYVEISRSVARRAVQVGGTESFSASSIIWTLFQTSHHRTELVKKALADVLTETLSGAVSRDYLNSIYLLGSKRPEGIRDSRLHRQGPPPSLAWRSLEALRGQFRRKIKSEALRNLAVARAYIYTFDESRLELYERHGPALLGPSNDMSCPSGVDQILSSAVELVSEEIIEGRSRPDALRTKEIEDCYRLLRRVAEDMAENPENLKLPMIRSRRSAQVVERDLETAFRSMWHATQRRVYRDRLRDVGADLLANIIVVSEQLPPERQSGRERYGRSSPSFAPIGAIQRVCDLLKPNPFEAFFSHWLARARKLEEAQGEIA